VLYLHRSARADYLVDALGDVLVEPLDDPLATEVVAVPTRGVERWITQRLSHRLGARAGDGDGVCANIDFPFPGTLLWMATAAACGFAPPARGDDPWAPEQAVWPLLQLVDEHMDDDFLSPLADHLRASGAPEKAGEPRRFATVRHVADLYDRYAVHRPRMVLEWLESSASPPTEGRDEAWQAQLWRRLRRRLAVPSPAERFQMAPDRLRSDAHLLALPSRLSVFGLTRLPASHLRVLNAISAQRDVHLFLLHPSGALWDKMAAAQPCPPSGLARRDDPTARLPAHPLLRSWGRDAREMQLVMASEGVTGGEHRAVAEPPPGLLGLIQADIRADRAPPGPPAPGHEDRRAVLAVDDDSLRVHSCHGRARQVEVVREAVLHLLATDPTLEPRDVIVMCPDIELFAPLVNATFGSAALAGAPELRARLADRSLRQTNPFSAVAAHLLELAGSRVTAAQVIDFASREPVCERFGFDEDALAQIERWLAGTGVRWGLDGAHRANWKLESLEVGTWQAGLDRLLLGVAMADHGDLFGGALPYGDLSGGEVELAGRLAELVDRLRSALDELARPQSPQSWARALLSGTASLTRTSTQHAWQSEEFRHALEPLVGEPTEAGRPDVPAALLDLSEARALLADRLRGRPTRANFRTGDMTICTLVPMRSVPHRVVCLLGLDDGLFPRAADQDGDDLLLARPEVGDRDPPSEDRQLLLDALLAATEHLIITFEGRDQHLNQPRPPSVPVAELLEVVDRTARCAGGGPGRAAVVVEHPLQPFDPRNFRPGGLCLPGPWRFDDTNAGGARALVAPRHAPPAFWPTQLPPVRLATVPLSSLIRFLEHPVKAFLRERLGFYAGDVPEIAVALRVEMSPLQRWGLGERLLGARLSGATWERAVQAERGRGLLPPGPLGEAALDEVMAVVEALVGKVDSLPSGPARPAAVEVRVALPDGPLVVGTVPGARNGAIVRCTYSKLAPKHRLRAWAQFVALSAAHPELVPSAVTIGQAESSNAAQRRLSVSTFGALAGDEDQRRQAAVEALGALVDLYERGMRQPLPLYCATSAAWAAAVRRGDDPLREARARWSSTYDGIQGECADPEHELVLGPAYPFDRLLGPVPDEDETGTGWALSQSTRVGRLALRLWEPVLLQEQLTA
jgi:exodeoxyribonuclease V gamma subunit